MKQTYKNASRDATKRRLATKTEVIVDLGKGLYTLFECFEGALEAYKREIANTPPLARIRGFEASYLNAKVVQMIQSNFHDDWRYGKYKRFILNLRGYLILIKKLNSKGVPMNIPTSHSMHISQQMSLSLFSNEEPLDPILFFGYTKDKNGQIGNPQLIYLDDNKRKWVITKDDLAGHVGREFTQIPTQPAAPNISVKPGVKRKASGE